MVQTKSLAEFLSMVNCKLETKTPSGRQKRAVVKKEEAVKILMERHEILRTSFKSINNVPKQKILKTDEIDFKAGCFAKTNAPIAKMVVNAAKIIEVLYVGISFLPVVYSF